MISLPSLSESLTLPLPCSWRLGLWLGALCMLGGSRAWLTPGSLSSLLCLSLLSLCIPSHYSYGSRRDLSLCEHLYVVG